MRRNAYFAAVLCLLTLCSSGLHADPVIGPAIERNGLRFEPWLASPSVGVQGKDSVPKKNTAATLFSVRVTNLTQAPLRLSPYALSSTLVGPNGQTEYADFMMIHGYIRQPQESDYILLQPGQVLVIPYPGLVYWRDDHLCLSLPSFINGHPLVYEGPIVGAENKEETTAAKIVTLMTGKHQGLPFGTYHFSMYYAMHSASVPICDDHTAKTIETLNGFWTGDVTTAPMTFELTPPKR